MSHDIVKDGDTVIIRMHDESGCMLQVSRSRDQKIGKTTLSVKALLGSPFGSVFEIEGRKIKRVQDEQLFDMTLEESDERTGDNRSFFDSNTAQKLTDDDIHKLRKAGASGSTIIQSLIANSETWNSKTEFAQEKWLKRKQKKYFRRFRVVKCTPATLCEAYHKRNNNKICNMRWDTLAQIRSLSGVSAGAHVLVFESLMGLVTGTLAYHMRGHGRIVSLFPGQQPHLDLVDRLNLSDADLSIIYTVPSTELQPASLAVTTTGLLPYQPLPHPLPTPQTQTVDELPAQTQNLDPSLDMDRPHHQTQNLDDHIPEVATETADTGAGAGAVEGAIRASGGRRQRGMVVPRPHQSSCKQPGELERGRDVLRQGATSLIIASRFRPLPVLIEALPLLAPSSSFVIYCEFMEPLVEVYLYLQQRNTTIGLQITDTWLREYQALPGRFHPNMFMSSSGGYLLSGIYVGMLAPEDCSAAAAGSLPMTSDLREDVVEPFDSNCRDDVCGVELGRKRSRSE